jgi:hypothetical protein
VEEKRLIAIKTPLIISFSSVGVLDSFVSFVAGPLEAKPIFALSHFRTKIEVDS